MACNGRRSIFRHGFQKSWTSRHFRTSPQRDLVANQTIDFSPPSAWILDRVGYFFIYLGFFFACACCQDGRIRLALLILSLSIAATCRVSLAVAAGDRTACCGYLQAQHTVYAATSLLFAAALGADCLPCPQARHAAAPAKQRTAGARPGGPCPGQRPPACRRSGPPLPARGRLAPRARRRRRRPPHFGMRLQRFFGAVGVLGPGTRRFCGRWR